MASIDFKTFWDAYDLKRNRRRAESAWNRLSMKDKCAAMSGIAPYRADCQQRGISMMYAQGYLNNRRWEDEFEGSVAVSVGSPVGIETEQSQNPPSSGSLFDMETW